MKTNPQETAVSFFLYSVNCVIERLEWVYYTDKRNNSIIMSKSYFSVFLVQSTMGMT